MMLKTRESPEDWHSSIPGRDEIQRRICERSAGCRGVLLDLIAPSETIEPMMDSAG
jgi:hypothetical protein